MRRARFVGWTLGVLGLTLGARATDLAEIQKSGTLRVLVVDGSPAFLSLKGGGEPGMDREILDGFARLHKLAVKPVEAPTWESLVPMTPSPSRSSPPATWS